MYNVTGNEIIYLSLRDLKILNIHKLWEVCKEYTYKCK